MRNRIGVSPMCQYNSVDGEANDWHLVHLGSRAVGGAGLVFTEGTAVSKQGRITPDDLGIWGDKHIKPLQRIVKFLAQYGAVPAMQLAHAGRKASTANPWRIDGVHGSRHQKVDLSDADGGWDIVSASAIPFQDTSRVPHALNAQQIKSVQQEFVAAAHRAVEAGFKIIEVHGGHGYLCHNFYSPLANNRQDIYGGSFENRIRFTVELMKSLREAIPEWMPLGIRLSCTDWVEGGWTIEESVDLARILKEGGVDFIDCSSGYGVAHARYAHGPSWQVPLSEAITNGAEILTATVGEISSPEQAADIIGAGKADFVLLAREFMREPYWPYKAANQLQLNNAFETLPRIYTYAI